MQAFHKIKWIIGVLIVFALIFATNQLDKQNFSKIKDSVDTIYEDRLVASDLLFDMSSVTHDLEIRLMTTDEPLPANNPAFKKLDELTTQFATTRLTSKEASLFSELQGKLEKLMDGKTSAKVMTDDKEMLLSKVKNVRVTLHDLSKIQLEEGRNQLFISNRAIDNVEFTTRIEFIMLVMLAIVLQVIIIYTPRSAAEKAKL